MSSLASTPRAARLRRSRRRNRPSVVVLCAAVVLVVLVALAAVPGLFMSGSPDAQDLTVGLTGPVPGHPLGTDELGRDVLARVIAGTRGALLGALGVAVCAWAIGGTAGVVAGFVGGRVDAIVMRTVDLVYALPGLLVTIVVGGVLGGGTIVAVGLLAILFSPIDARIARAATLELRGQPFVEAARMLGTSRRRILVRHIAPNVAPLQLANSILQFAFAIVALASLSFLGIGSDPGAPEWGRMLSDGRTLMGTNLAAVLAPGLAIAMAAASVNVVGEWVYSRLSARGSVVE